MKLYSSWLSPYAARCRMQIYAKALEVEIVDLPGNPKPPALYAVNPIGKVPTLEHDGVVVAESAVICEYLEEVHPEPSLLAGTPAERAGMRLLARVADLYVMTPAFTLFDQLDPARRDEGAVRGACERVEKGLAWLEHSLDGGGGFAIGGRLTLADCALVPHLTFLTLFLPLAGAADAVALHGKLAKYRAESRRGDASQRVIGEIERAFAALERRLAERFARREAS